MVRLKAVKLGFVVERGLEFIEKSIKDSTTTVVMVRIIITEAIVILILILVEEAEEIISYLVMITLPFSTPFFFS